MTLTTYSNRGKKEFIETYLWSLKKNRGMMALLALLMFLALPLILMVLMANTSDTTELNSSLGRQFSHYTNYVYALSCFAVTPLVLIFTLVIAVLLFSYLHQKRSVDLFHSLPVGRTPMLLGRWCAGLTAIFAPILVNYIIAAVIGLSYGVDAAHTLSAVAGSMLWLMLMSAAALTFTVFMAVCTGTTFDMVISVLGINVAYPLLIFVTCSFAGFLLPGLNISLSPESTVLTAFSPFAAAFLPYFGNMGSRIDSLSWLGKLGGGFLVWWIVLTLIMLAASVLLYKKRKSECAESSFAFPIPKIIIRFIVTAVAGLGMGLLFQMSTNSPFSFFIGLAAGSLAAHIVVEAVYSRGFKQMRRSFAYYGIFVALFLVVYGVLATGFFGYDTRLPNPDDVESVSVSLPYQYGNGSTYDIYQDNYYAKVASISPTLKEKANISKVLELHKDFIEANRSSAYPYRMQKASGSDFTIAYHLKNGSILKRVYSDSYTRYGTGEIKGDFDTLASQITKMQEYIRTSSILFYLEPEQIKSVDINIGKAKNVTVAPDETVKAELLEALKQDYLDGQVNSMDLGNEYKEIPDNISIECKESIPPTGKLKELLGNYSGTVVLPQSNYTLSDNAVKTKTLIEKYGWDK